MKRSLAFTLAIASLCAAPTIAVVQPGENYHLLKCNAAYHLKDFAGVSKWCYLAAMDAKMNASVDSGKEHYYDIYGEATFLTSASIANGHLGNYALASDQRDKARALFKVIVAANQPNAAAVKDAKYWLATL